MRSADIERLLEFYQSHRRDLPWRQNRDPYRVLVSEIMLQQTTVQTVTPRFKSFLERFPAVEDLAAANQDEVLAQWSGLGYYSRARRLHQAAQEIVRRGRFPDTREGLMQLPGLGDYTAAAVASIAFGQPAVAIDTNAWRVFARYYGLDGALTGTIRKELKARLEPVIPKGLSGEFTQAVMELGALLCRPTPDCLLCPLKEGCQAFADGRTDELPVRPKKRKPIRVLRAAGVVVREAKVLVVRPQPGLFEGMWVPPMVKVGDQKEAASTLETFLREWGRPRRPQKVGEVQHGITHRRIRCLVFRVSLDNPVPGSRWVPLAQLEQTPMPSFAHAILRYGRSDPSS